MKYSTLFSFSALALLFLLALKTPQTELWKHKVDTNVFINTANNASADFIIQFKDKANLTAAAQLSTKEEKGKYVFQKLQQTALASQKEVKQILQNQNLSFRPFLLVNAIQTHGDIQLIQQLAERNEVARIISNPQIKQEELVAEPILEAAQSRDANALEWGLTMIGADQVWAMGYNGQGVTVAGEDTGYEWEHPALKNAYRGWDGTNADHNYHWHDAIHEISPLHNDPMPDPSLNPCGLEVGFPCDDNNHGTHTMGTMIGEDGDNQIGVAPGAKWIACRNMERGYGSPTTYIECFEFFLAPTDLNGENPKPEMAPHVINNSWGCPEMEGCNSSNWSIMDEVVNNLKAAGIVVVVSAGNDGPNCETVRNPASIFANSFSVGATAANDTITGFSSRGAVTVDGSNRMKPNISAPGRQVRSAVRGGGYQSFSGTSMAGPHVAGMVALIISANPELAGQVEVIENIIESTAFPRTTGQECNGTPGSAVPNNTYGFGRIDAVKAVEAALITVSNQETREPNTAQVRVSPNPFKEEVNFQLEAWEGDTQIRIFNASGQEVFQEQLEVQGQQSKTFNLAQLPGGIYFYRVENAKQELSGKLFKL